MVCNIVESPKSWNSMNWSLTISLFPFFPCMAWPSWGWCHVASLTFIMLNCNIRVTLVDKCHCIESQNIRFIYRIVLTKGIGWKRNKLLILGMSLFLFKYSLYVMSAFSLESSSNSGSHKKFKDKVLSLWTIWKQVQTLYASNGRHKMDYFLLFPSVACLARPCTHQMVHP